MDEFEDIQSLCEYLEENAFKYKYEYSIADLFRALRDQLSKNGKSSDAEKAQWELDVLNFVLRDGEISTLIQPTDDNGNIIEYPHMNRFNDNAFDYLIKRFESTSNVLLKSRYAHVLWFSPIKNGKYSQSAIDSYLKLIEIYEEKDKDEPDGHYGLSVLSAIKNAYYLSLQSNDDCRIETTKNKVMHLIYFYNPKSTSLLTIREHLIKLMLKDSKIFKEKNKANLSEEERYHDVHPLGLGLNDPLINPHFRKKQ